MSKSGTAAGDKGHILRHSTLLYSTPPPLSAHGTESAPCGRSLRSAVVLPPDLIRVHEVLPDIIAIYYYIS